MYDPFKPEYASETKMQTELKENLKSHDLTGLCPTVWQMMLRWTIALVYTQSYLASSQACNKIQRGELRSMKSNTHYLIKVLSELHYRNFFLSLTNAVWQTLALIKQNITHNWIVSKDNGK